MLVLFLPKSSAMCRNLRRDGGEGCNHSLNSLFPWGWKRLGDIRTFSGISPAKAQITGQERSSSR